MKGQGLHRWFVGYQVDQSKTRFMIKHKKFTYFSDFQMSDIQFVTF